MSTKTAAMWGVIVGGFIGGYIPSLWGAGVFSLSGILFSAIGGILGIIAGYKIAN